MPKTNFGEGIPDVGIERLLLYSLVLSIMLKYAITHQKLIFNKWTLIIASYSIFVFASISWSNYPYNGFTIQQYFMKVFTPFIIALMSLNILKEKEIIHFYIKNILIASSVLSVIAIFQMISGSATYYGEVARATSLFGNPNTLAIFLVLFIPCLAHCMENRIFPRPLRWFIFTSVMGGILCTVSRKGIVTAILAFLLFYFFKKQYKKVIVIGLGALLIVFFLSGYYLFSARFAQEKLDHDLAGKWSMAYAGLQMFVKSPIIGLGWKGYYDSFGEYFPGSRQARKGGYDAHNIFVTALSNYGSVGFIFFLGIFIYPISYARKTIKQARPLQHTQFSRDLAVMSISSVIPFMISGWFAGGLFYTPKIVFILYTHMSFAFYNKSFQSNNVIKEHIKTPARKIR